MGDRGPRAVVGCFLRNENVMGMTSSLRRKHPTTARGPRAVVGCFLRNEDVIPMTFSLRRKHPTTARGPRSPIRTAISLLALALVFHARPAPAQNYYGSPTAPYPPASSRGPAALQFAHDSAPTVIP